MQRQLTTHKTRPVAFGLLIGFALIGMAAICQAAIQFPKLSGRIVDQANMISPAAEKTLDGHLAAHERAAGNQIVVVTLPDIQGQAIEEYAYQLGRHWGIGQKGKDNGTLLIVAEAERRIRIEVGYGLEGTLTDAISHNIIRNVISPKFKRGQFEAGISQGTLAIIEALGGQYEMQTKSTKDQDDPPAGIIFIFAILMLLSFFNSFRGRHRHSRGYGFFGSSGGFRGGGFGGGGFSGGGGGFGGGGASGGW